jgi:hypothetical protein
MFHKHKVSLAALIFVFLIVGSKLKAQLPAVVIPDVAGSAKAIVTDIHGTYTSQPKFVPSSGMPGGPVAGNGDVALVMGGGPDHLTFYIGKADFFGVTRGGIMPVGSLALDVPELRGSAYHVDENIASATLAGKFTNKDGSELSLNSWVSATRNLVVIELTNTGTQALNLSSRLADGFSTNGNQATYSSSENSTSLKVSPDTVNVEIGNRHHGGKPGAFQGQIADVRIFDQALPGAELSALDSTGSPKALFQWQGSDHTPLKGKATLDATAPHGGAVTFTGDNNAEAWLAALLVPQKRFTISAWVQATGAKDQNFIFSAMGDPYHPRGYPYMRGFNLCLNDGKLSASLNQTTVTSSDTFPLNKWVQIAATYDGQALTLYTDGTEVGATTDFPAAQDVMGWQQNTIHFGDKDLPFAGCGPEGLMVQRVVGPDTKEADHRLIFLLAPGEQATLVLSVVTDRNTPDFSSMAQQLVQKADKASLATLYQAHTDWWNAFWSKSFIKIPDQKIQDSWYASLYLLACCSHANCPPPGLWGNFVTMRDMGWQGDYTLNYNYEAPFWAAYPTNHLELADNYEKPLLDYIPRGMAIAQHEKQQGLFFYTHMIPSPGWDDDQTTFMKQKGCTLYALVNCAQRWKYTHDLAYAKKIYPLLKGAADFWDNYLVLKDGQYVDHDDAAGEETGGNNNTTTTLAFIRLIYPSLIEISQQLNLDADQRNKWQDIVEKLAPFPVVPAATVDHIEKEPATRTLQDLLGPELVQNKMVIRNSDTGYGFPTPMIKVFQDKKQRTSSGGMNSSQAIFPAWAIGLESESSLREAAFNTVDFDSHWFDANNDCAFYPAAACIGYDPKAILQHLDELLDTEYPSFIIPTRGGGTEDFAIVPATISAMFLQSYQQNIHLFPDWPMEQDASFGNLAACGGFLISSQVAQGQVK